MDITYKNNKLQKICTDASVARRVHGDKMARKIHQRIDQIQASDTIETLIQFNIGRCHPLIGDRAGQYAMDLVHPYRLIFEINGTEIQIANITDITDYH